MDPGLFCVQRIESVELLLASSGESLVDEKTDQDTDIVSRPEASNKPGKVHSQGRHDCGGF